MILFSNFLPLRFDLSPFRSDNTSSECFTARTRQNPLQPRSAFAAPRTTEGHLYEKAPPGLLPNAEAPPLHDASRKCTGTRFFNRGPSCAFSTLQLSLLLCLRLSGAPLMDDADFTDPLFLRSPTSTTYTTAPLCLTCTGRTSPLYTTSFQPLPPQLHRVFYQPRFRAP